MKQRELAARLGVHFTTVGLWERNKFFPEQHWAALNKLLRISLTPPGEAAPPAEPEPPPIPPEVLDVIRKNYAPELQAEAIRMLQQLNDPTGQAGEAPSGTGRGDARAG